MNFLRFIIMVIIIITKYIYFSAPTSRAIQRRMDNASFYVEKHKENSKFQ